MENLLYDILKIEGNIMISDAHRLPKSNTSKRHRPLIFKLSRILDKRKIAESLPKLKIYNKDQFYGNRIFIDLDHLPSKWKQDRYSLKKEFKTAWEAKLKPTFKPDRKTGEYCLHVGNRIIRPNPSHLLRLK